MPLESLAANKLKQLICVQWSEKESLELFSHFPFRTEMSSHQPRFSFSHILSQCKFVGSVTVAVIKDSSAKVDQELVLSYTISFQILLCYPEKNSFFHASFLSQVEEYMQVAWNELLLDTRHWLCAEVSFLRVSVDPKYRQWIWAVCVSCAAMWNASMKFPCWFVKQRLRAQLAFCPQEKGQEQNPALFVS